MQPLVTAVCPTYGRHSHLREAVACFLLQTLPNRRMVILNDGEPSLRLTRDGNLIHLPPSRCTVEVCNNPDQYDTLGHKRQAMLTACDSEYIAHWDDDDWYLPWHLASSISHLRSRTDKHIVRTHPRRLRGRGRPLCVREPGFRAFDAQIVYERRHAIQVGGYTYRNDGESFDLRLRFADNGYDTYSYPDRFSYCRRRDHGTSRSNQHHHEECTDFGEGQPLIDRSDAMAWARDTLRQPWTNLLRGLRLSPRVCPSDIDAAAAALEKTYEYGGQPW